ncbi:MAG: hypothetical protein Q8S26_01880 [Azonexus sp.]|nr:hypothetical protein [Azonexus sp.]
MIVDYRCPTVHKFVEREILAFNKPVLLNPLFNPVSKLLFALQKRMKVTRIYRFLASIVSGMYRKFSGIINMGVHPEIFFSRQVPR